MATRRDYYKVLMVDPEADADVIQAAYEVLAARFNPDSDLTGVHEVRLRDLKRAYAVLADPGRRRAYDIERSESYRPMGPGELIGASAAVPEHQPATAVAAVRGLSARVKEGSAGAIGSTVINFGRFAGMTLEDVARTDLEYLRWLTRHSSGIRFRNEIVVLLRSMGEEA